MKTTITQLQARIDRLREAIQKAVKNIDSGSHARAIRDLSDALSDDLAEKEAEKQPGWPQGYSPPPTTDKILPTATPQPPHKEINFVDSSEMRELKAINEILLETNRLLDAINMKL